MWQAWKRWWDGQGERRDARMTMELAAFVARAARVGDPVVLLTHGAAILQRALGCENARVWTDGAEGDDGVGGTGNAGSGWKEGIAPGGFSLRIEPDETRAGVTLHAGARPGRPYGAEDLVFAGSIAQIVAQGLGAARAAALRRHLSEALAHEIQPLQASLEINAGLLGAAAGSPPLLRTVARMKRLTSDAVDALKRGDGGFEPRLEIERQGLAGLLLESLAQASAVAEAHRVHLSGPGPEAELLSVRCDRERLVRALSRMLESCARAGAAGSHLRVGGRRSGRGRVEVLVECSSALAWPELPAGSLAFALEAVRAQGATLQVGDAELRIGLPEAEVLAPPRAAKEKLQAVREQMRKIGRV